MLHLLLLVATALGADPEFVGAATPGQDLGAPRWSGAAELGGVWTSGNTVAYALTANLQGARTWSRNRLGLGLAANVGRGLADTDADGRLDPDERTAPMVETARKYAGDLRYDRFVGKKDSLYLLVGTLADPFSGYDNRAHGQLGYSRTFRTGKPLSFVAELGADVAREDTIEGTDPALQWVYAGRVMGGLGYTFGPGAELSERLEIYENIRDVEDLRVLSTLAFTARMSTVFSLRISHSLTFDNQPVEGFLPLDLSTVATVVARLP